MKQILSILLAFGVLATGVLGAEELNPGETALVVRDDVDFGTKGHDIARLKKGDEVRVVEISDPWVGCSIPIAGKEELGWIHKRDLIRKVNWADVETPTDEASAVAALRKMNVRVDRGARGAVHAVYASGVAVPNEALVSLPFLPSLVVLDLGGTKVTDASLANVEGMDRLERLYLDDTDVTDEGLKHLQGLSNLEVLVLEGTKITGAGLAVIESLGELRTLNLSSCAIQDEDLKHVSAFAKLEVLTLRNTKISGEGFKYLRSIKPLRVLNLDNSEVQDAALTHLEGMPSLRMLHLHDTEISQEAADRLDGTLTSCAIYLSH